MNGLVVIGAEEVRRRLTAEACIPLIRSAMQALSAGETPQLLRSFITLGEGRTFALMPAALGGEAPFGSKLVSVFHDPTRPGRAAHEGLVALFDGASGLPLCVADAGEVTRVRTGAASAVATEALARPDASKVAVLGLGAQARSHVMALQRVRPLTEVRLWGRDHEAARRFAATLDREFEGLACRAFPTVADTVAEADIVCTLTGSPDPILKGAWVRPGTHVNVVGSSSPLRAEIDEDLVASSLFVADHRDHVLVHGGEFLRARAAGRVEDDHIAAEIGDVIAGRHPGRETDDQITLYKSLGHAVQDLAATAWLYNTRETQP